MGIRIGGSLGKLGNKLKRGAGKALSSPLGRLAAGVLFGPAGAAAAGLAGDVLDTSEGKFNVAKAGRRAVGDYALGKAAQYATGKVGGLFKDGAPATMPPAEGGFQSIATGPSPSTWQTALEEAKSIQGPLSAAPSRFRQIVSGAPGFLSRHKDDIGDLGRTAERVYGNYRQAMQEDERLADWRRRAPLRDRAQALLMDESRPDYSYLTADPNLRYRRVGA